MSMYDWAKREVEIACERERKASGTPEGKWDYGAACYESALKAYKSLCEDGHSGMSFSLTRGILERLMEGKPLTPIDDIPEVWSERVDRHDGITSYQCKRMSSLFKDVHPNGTVTYSDINDNCCYDINNPTVAHHFGLVRNIMEEMFPITMPYKPSGYTKVYYEEFLFDATCGDFDTVGIFYAIKPDDEKVKIDRFFKEYGQSWKEIDSAEYYHRKEQRVK